MRQFSCIAIDAMGGDFGPRVTVKASLEALKLHSDIRITLVGNEAELRPLITSSFSDRLSIEHADSVIDADSRVIQVLRDKRDSSMHKALGLLHRGEADSVVSAGNTGALMALSRRILGTLDGIDRPAITAAVPTLEGQCQVLDLGANIDCSSEMLVQFAVLGSALLRVDLGIQRPRVGLLNIGVEQSKGTETLRETSVRLAQVPGIEYIGFVEGDDLYAGRADLVVCDGLIGNVALKSSEGLARLIRQKVRRSFKRSFYRRILAMLARPVLQELQSELDAGSRNGAILLGLNGVVVKSHGSASVREFLCAIEAAHMNVQRGLNSHLKAEVARCLG